MDSGEFDVISYLNSCFSAGQTALDEVNASLINTQLLNAKICKELDDSIDSVTSQLPRLVGEVELIVKQSKVVGQKLCDINETLGAVETQDPGNNIAFRELVDIEVVRQRMQDSFDLLKEVDRWNSLELDVRAAIQSKSMPRAVSLLHEAKQHADAATFGNYSDKEKKLELINQLGHILEDALSPSLIAALAAFDFESISNSFDMLSKIDKSDTFFSHYFDARNKELVRMWNDLLKTIDQHKDAHKFLAAFYDETFAIVKREVNWSFHIFRDDFGRCVQGIVEYGIRCLENPSFDKVISSKFSSLQSLDDLSCAVDLYQLTEIFLLKIEKLIHSRKEDLRNDDCFNAEIDYQWSQVIMKPFSEAQSKFIENVRRLSRNVLDQLLDGDGKRNRIGRFQDAMPAAFEIIYRINDLCTKFTHNYAVHDIAKLSGDILEYTLQSFISFMISERNHAIQSSLAGWEHFNNAIKSLTLIRQFHSKFYKYVEFLTTLHIKVDHDLARFTEYISSGSCPSGVEDEKAYVSENGTSISLFYSKRIFTLKAPSETDVSLERSMTERLLFSAIVRAQEFVSMSMIYPLLAEINSISSLDVWYSDKISSSNSMALSGFEVPKFSLSPSAYAQRIGEHLLSLPQHLDIPKEVQKEDDANSILGFMSDLLPEVYKHWPIPDSYNAGVDLITSFRRPSNDSDTYVAAHTWLILICQLVAKNMSKAILSIRKGALTSTGRHQLTTDLDYIFTIFAALGVYQSDSKVEGLLELDAVFLTLKASNDKSDILGSIESEVGDTSAINLEIQKLVILAQQKDLKGIIYNTVKLCK